MRKILFFLSLVLIFGIGFNFAQAVAQVNEEAVMLENTEDINTENISNAKENGEIIEKPEVDPEDVIYGTYTENIDSFNSEIEINEDSSIEVKETIVYNFGSLERHGIYREIPYKYNARGGNFKLRFSDISVKDEKGNNYNFATSKSGNNIRIKIGDADKYVTGIKTYVISYRIERALNYFQDHDELYWNATGNEWEVPISSTQVKIKLPEGIGKDDLQLKCYTGQLGSAEEYCTGEIIDDQTVLYKSDYSLAYYEGLTVVLGWSKGVTTEPSFKQKMLWVLFDNWYLGLPILVFLFSFLYWRMRGKDPKGRGTVIAHYEPPDNLTSAEIGTVYDNKADNKDITAMLIQLAINGYLKIKQYGKGKSDYEFIRMKSEEGLKNEFEKKLFNAIFDSGDKKKLSSMKNKFYKDMQEIKRDVYKEVTKKGYYSRNPNRARFGLLFILSMLSLVGSFVLGGIATNFFLGAAMFISGIIMFVFSMLMSQKTVKGAQTLEKIQGFKQFLEVTEKERLKFHNPPNMVPELFEKYLPYAMALGVENRWAENFRDIYNQAPDWYEGYGTGTNMWSAVALTNSLNSFSTNSQSVMVSAPSSTASGGGSGFSGGGSGGGFGGGGGGSW